MRGQKRRLNAPSLARQRHYVISLGEEVLSAPRAQEAEECELWRESRRNPWEYVDEGRSLACLQADGSRVVHAFAFLPHVDQAPQKIQERTSGFSGVSGRQIPQERLEMLPAAICTLDEEQAFEGGSKLGRLQ